MTNNKIEGSGVSGRLVDKLPDGIVSVNRRLCRTPPVGSEPSFFEVPCPLRTEGKPEGSVESSLERAGIDPAPPCCGPSLYEVAVPEDPEQAALDYAQRLSERSNKYLPK
ncbi:hypothetical protein HN832_01785 [archaeon]|jgi:hypothetical protein|nr:hypothetical protein [archaeon]MBT4373086.1 hypothetical protein [archaeon]MBT4531431.1 hypothetical protein [archaeon]MBT7001391.1 hypothetical protein [archaeon]MBT7282123.1 hypothetical protein [archaeon]